MRAIEDSPWLDSPLLIEIHAVTVGGARLSEFKLNFNLSKATGDAASPADPAKAKN
jgi:type IV pilus assembly protein PilN